MALHQFYASALKLTNWNVQGSMVSQCKNLFLMCLAGVKLSPPDPATNFVVQLPGNIAEIPAPNWISAEFD